jgi:hypothetical protein
MTLPSAYDFEKLTEAISFYTSKVVEVMKARDHEMHSELICFKKELHERIDREYVQMHSRASFRKNIGHAGEGCGCLNKKSRRRIGSQKEKSKQLNV